MPIFLKPNDAAVLFSGHAANGSNLEEQSSFLPPAPSPPLTDSEVVLELDKILKIRRGYNASKVSIIQFFLVASCAFITAFFQNFAVLNQFVSLGTIIGLGIVHGRHYSCDKQIQALLKGKSFAQLCFYQSAVNDPHKTVLLSLEKMQAMRSEAPSQGAFFKDLQSALDDLSRLYPPEHPGSLDVFYNTVKSYNTFSTLEKIKHFIFRTKTDRVLPVEFWAKLYCQAAVEGNIELMHRIHSDWTHIRLDTSGSSNLESFKYAVEKQKNLFTQRPLTDPADQSVYMSRLNQVDALQDVKPPIDIAYTPQEKWNLRLISLNRIFGKDLVLSMADIKIYLTKQILLANQYELSMGAAATGSFLGLTLPSLVPVTLAVFATGGLAWILRVAFREYLRGKIQNESLKDFVSNYHDSQDDRWISLIHLKIEQILNNPNYDQRIALFREALSVPSSKTDPYQSTFEEQKIFFTLSNYLETRREDLSYHQSQSLIAAAHNSTNASIQHLAQNFMPKLEPQQPIEIAQAQEKKYNTLNNAIYYMQKRDTLTDLVFPLNTAMNTVLSSIVLAIPLSALVAACFITILPAACAIVMGLALGAYGLYLKHKTEYTLASLDLPYMLTQADIPLFARLLQKKLEQILSNPQKNQEEIQKAYNASAQALSDPLSIPPKMHKYYEIVHNKLSQCANVKLHEPINRQKSRPM